jgi:hypothetical protein
MKSLDKAARDYQSGNQRLSLLHSAHIYQAFLLFANLFSNNSSYASENLCAGFLLLELEYQNYNFIFGHFIQVLQKQRKKALKRNLT